MPDTDALTELFHYQHEKVYSFRDLASSVEITAERLRVVGEIPRITLPRVPAATLTPPPSSIRNLYLDGCHVAATVYQRDDLRCAPHARAQTGSAADLRPQPGQRYRIRR